MFEKPNNTLQNILFCVFFAGLVAAGFFLFLVLNYNLLREYAPALPDFSNRPVQKSKQNIFYGVSVEMNQILPSSPTYVRNSKGEDLIDIAAKLGVNLVRITNSSLVSSNKDGIFSKNDWDTVLNKLQKNGIQAIILIESPTLYQKNIPQTYIPFIKKYLDGGSFLNHANIYAIDLYNEPAITENNVALLTSAKDIVKSFSPQTRVTVGWWAEDTHTKDKNGIEIYDWTNYRLGKVLEPIIDYYSIHMYGFDKSRLGIFPDPYVFSNNFIASVQGSLQTKKPILVEEFGAANGETLSDQNTIGSPEIQAKAYEGVYKAIVDMQSPQIVGSIAYQLNQKTNKPDAWAIIKDNGNYFFPAAYVLQKYATHQ